VLADELERLEDLHEGLGLLTITAVKCDPDLRHALVLLSSLSDSEAEALSRERVRLQSAIAAQVRLKRTPQLRFAADPAVAAGTRVEDILRGLQPPGGSGSSSAAGSDGSVEAEPHEPLPG
jgi:ribosome-binding factor A